MLEATLNTLSLEQDTTTTEKATNQKPTQQLKMSQTQPRNLLHTLPQELQDEISALVVVSPTPLPARVRLLDVPTAPDTTSQGETNESSGALSVQQILVTPTQPALSRVDRAFRMPALRIFYAKNAFLFTEHRTDSAPLRKWIDTITRTPSAYGDALKLVRRVMVEKKVGKTCGLSRPRLPYHRPRGEHLYRIAVTEHPDGALSVEFGADLAGICACTVRTAALVRPPRLASRGSPWLLQEEGLSEALAFAVDIEQDLYLAQQCTWQFCDAKALTACSDCGLSVHGDEKLRQNLLEWYQVMAEHQRKREAREAEGEKARIRREADRAAAIAAGRPASDGCVVM
jgi:hypothetical protein